MAYNEELAFRIKKILIQENVEFLEKKMFGGLAFMIKDKMCIGIIKEELMIRVMDEFYENLLEANHVSPMNFTGKKMKGFLFIEAEGVKYDSQLLNWIKYALDFGKRGILKTKKKTKK
jgi:TfoX/Sxy family transcriptional regulator of competence genes